MAEKVIAPFFSSQKSVCPPVHYPGPGFPYILIRPLLKRLSSKKNVPYTMFSLNTVFWSQNQWVDFLTKPMLPSWILAEEIEIEIKFARVISEELLS